MTTKIYSVTDTQTKIQVDGTDVVTINKVGGIVAGVSAAAIAGLTITQANQTPLPGAGSLLSFTHGLGAVPVSAELELVCLVADLGYSAGDVVQGVMTQSATSYYTNFCIRKTATTVEARCGNQTSAFALVHYSTGAYVSITVPANWAWRFKVRAA